MCFQGFPWVPLHLSQAGLHLGQRHQRAFLPSIWITPPNTHICQEMWASLLEPQDSQSPWRSEGACLLSKELLSGRWLSASSESPGTTPVTQARMGEGHRESSRKGQQGCSWPLSRDRKNPEGTNTDDTGAHRKERKRKKRLENSGPNTPTLPWPASVTFNPSTCYTSHLVSFLTDAIALFSPE